MIPAAVEVADSSIIRRPNRRAASTNCGPFICSKDWSGVGIVVGTGKASGSDWKADAGDGGATEQAAPSPAEEKTKGGARKVAKEAGRIRAVIQRRYG